MDMDNSFLALFKKGSRAVQQPGLLNDGTNSRDDQAWLSHIARVSDGIIRPFRSHAKAGTR